MGIIRRCDGSDLPAILAIITSVVLANPPLKEDSP